MSAKGGASGGVRSRFLRGTISPCLWSTSPIKLAAGQTMLGCASASLQVRTGRGGEARPAVEPVCSKAFNPGVAGAKPPFWSYSIRGCQMVGRPICALPKSSPCPRARAPHFQGQQFQLMHPQIRQIRQNRPQRSLPLRQSAKPQTVRRNPVATAVHSERHNRRRAAGYLRPYT